jgi:hypothetical protein
VSTNTEPQNPSPAAPDATDESKGTARNAAVEHCVAEWTRVYRTERAKGEGSVFASTTASVSYRAAMPSLIGSDNIRDFIACVARGVLLGAIDSKDSSKLLYAAQVALSAQPRPSPQRRRTSAE